MAAFRTIAGRVGKKRLAATSMVVAGFSALLLATEVPSALMPAGGGSAALAELLARSPGARVGGVALKAKSRNALAMPASSNVSPADNPSASVLGLGVVPEGPVPGYGPNDFPSDFSAPAVPAALDGVPAPNGSSPVPGFDFPGSGGGIGGGGGPIFVPGVPETGGPGGNGPNNPGTDLPLPPTVPGIPEPSTWLMLIGGFGLIGAAMRRKRRVAIA